LAHQVEGAKAVASYQRFVDKAQRMVGAKLVLEVHELTGYAEYFVQGSKGDVYSMFVVNRFVCGCPAGQHGLHCYHAGAVWLHRLANATLQPKPDDIPAEEEQPKLTECSDCRGPLN
jgi:hypothetical protein